MCMSYKVLYLSSSSRELNIPYDTVRIHQLQQLRDTIEGYDLLLIDSRYELSEEAIQEVNQFAEVNRLVLMLYKWDEALSSHHHLLEHQGILNDNTPVEDMCEIIEKLIHFRKRLDIYADDSELLELFLKYNKSYVFFKDDDARVLKLSENYMDMLGIPVQEAIGKTMMDIFPPELAESMVMDDLRIIKNGDVVEVVEELNGKFYKTSKFPVYRKNDKPLLAGFTIDITDLKEAEKELIESKRMVEALTVTDDLLGINNRRGLLNCMTAEIERIKRKNITSAIMLIDIDRFKELNDALGHFKADLFLHDFVKKVSDELRGYDVFGRLGGDEFTIICSETSVEEALVIAERIRCSVNETPVIVDEHPHYYSISIGVMSFGSEMTDVYEILERVDVALYEAKESGRNQCKVV